MEYESLKAEICELTGEGADAFCDFAIYDDTVGARCQLIMAGFFKRGVSTLRYFTANSHMKTMQLKKGMDSVEFTPNKGNINAYFSVFNGDYEKIEQCIVINKLIGTKYIFCTDESAEEVFYHYLMHNFDLPLMQEWSGKLLEYCQLEQVLTRVPHIDWCSTGTQELPVNGKNVPFGELLVFKAEIEQKWLDNAIQQLAQAGEIYITPKQQKKLELGKNATMDTYFQKYGYTIVDNLTKEMHPLVSKKPIVEELALKSKKLFPQQAVSVNGVANLLKYSKYALLNEGMGCGKSLQAAAAVEAYHIKKYLASHPGKTLKDIYNDPSAINYRVIIMAPGHLLEKWADEYKSQIPYCKIQIIKNFTQIIDIWQQGKERNGKEIYIASKDFLKLSSQLRPLPTKIFEKNIPRLFCAECGTAGQTNALAKHHRCDCGSKKWRIERVHDEFRHGLICPECGEVLVCGNGSNMRPLMPADFANKNNFNSKCWFCGTNLWTMNVHNLNGKEKKGKWYKISHYANKTHKTRTTSWALRGYERELYVTNKIEPAYAEESSEIKMRKFSPCTFIKHHMKNFFDVAIFDELHLYKGGGTAQGNAMHCLVKASKKVLGLTGTIAGGVAEDLFYLLFRLDPGRMIKRGFRFNNVAEFTKTYGTIENAFESDENASHNSSSRGKKLRQPRTKPGISPLIFGDFLIDKAVFLDLVDMGAYIPPLKEQVIAVPMDEGVLCEYVRVLDIFRNLTKGPGLNPLSSAMLHFSLSYLDKPFGYGTIIEPKTGEKVAKPRDFFPEDGNLLPKEQKLVELIDSELKEGRRVFVYAEYTGKGSTCITHRLKEILEDHCQLKGKVAILESSSPAATKREKWIHIMAEKGIEVFITNPKNVETGLDFIFNYNGIQYNYPTLIFYQMGYNLFTLWQASRRAFRLSQTEECRTYYLAYEKTIQMTVLEIMGSKQIATSAIQGGNFSSEGLSAMANGVDARLKMIQALQENVAADENAIKDMLTSSIKKIEDEFANFDISAVPVFYDLLREDTEEHEDEKNIQTYCLTDNLFAFFEAALNSVKAVKKEDKEVIDVTNTVKEKNCSLVLTEIAKTSRSAVKGQLSLF